MVRARPLHQSQHSYPPAQETTPTTDTMHTAYSYCSTCTCTCGVIINYQCYFSRSACVGNDSSAHREVSVVDARSAISSKVLTDAANDVLSLTLGELRCRHDQSSMEGGGSGDRRGLVTGHAP